jgi:molybdate transport system substrate-binding protein
LLLVSRGEAPFGIVYETDARADARVTVVAVFPEDSHLPIVYPAALVGAAETAAPAARVLAALQTPAAETVFVRHGFQFLPRR